MSTKVLVPPLGQTVDTVTLVTWYKREGETVVQGEPLFAIETDKATLDVEAPASGVLRGVTAQPGDAVQALRAIAVIGEPSPLAPLPKGRGQGMLSPSGGEIERGLASAGLSGCDDLTIFEQPVYFS